MKIKVFRLLIIFQLFIQCILLLSFNSITYASSNENEEDVYDVILFWGQSNMVGWCSDNVENRYDPNNEEEIKEYSELSGISKDFLANTTQRNRVNNITQESGTVFEYKYIDNKLEEITEKTTDFGEDLIYEYDEENKVGELKAQPDSNGKKSLNKSKGTNIIPEFCRQYSELTGHKVVAVSAALKGKPIGQFLPYHHEDNPYAEQELRLHEAIIEKYNKAIAYLNGENSDGENSEGKKYKIGRKMYVVFQGENDVIYKTTTENYNKRFNAVHTIFKNTLGIEKGAIIETAVAAGTYDLSSVNAIHKAQEDIINGNDDIILGSSFPYDRYIPEKEEYETYIPAKGEDYVGCGNKVSFNSAGNKLDYQTALKRARMCEDYQSEKANGGNAIHFTSAALCQIGREASINLANSYIPPQLTAQYSTTMPTNQDVKVTIASDEKVREIEGWDLSDDGKILTKEYTENCEEEITVYDLEGNSTKIDVSVKNIDKVAPQLELQYSTTNTTNQNVTVTITSNEKVQEVEGWTISNDKKVLTKKYFQNKSEDVTVYDLAGNSKKINVSVTNIDKDAPQLELQYSTTTPTNQNVTATIKSNEQVKFIDGWALSGEGKILTKEYTENCEEEITVYDLAGNSKKINVSVTNIDKVAPQLELQYSTEAPTNQNVTVTITSNEKVQEVEGWTISNDKKALTKIYTVNCTENVTVYDLAGNSSEPINITINQIDRDIPNIEVKYSTTEKTNQDVLVSLSSDKQIQQIDGWQISDDKKTLTKVYKENVVEDIVVYDVAGKKSRNIRIVIDNIDKIAPEVVLNYDITILTNRDIKATISANESLKELEGWTLSDDERTLTRTYFENFEGEIKVYDLAGNYANLSISIKNIDKIATNINIEYSTTKLTNKDVTVVLNSNEEIQKVDGWNISEDRKVLTKIFDNNSKEDIIIKDLAGNETKIKLEVKNIDKTIPKIEVEYILNDDKSQVVVVIKSDKELQPMEGWVLSGDGKTLTKVFYQNEKKEILIYDLAENSFKLDLKVTEIEEKTIEDNKEKEEKKENSISNDITNTNSDKSQAPNVLPNTGLTRIIIALIFIFAINILYTYNKYKKLNG